MSQWKRLILGIVLLLSACNSTAAPTLTPAPEQTPTTSLPTPVVHTTPAPDARAAAQAFLDAWQSEDYPAMYAMLTSISQDAITVDDFTARYRDFVINLTLSTLEPSILSVMTTVASAQVGFSVTYNTAVVGQLTRAMVMNLVLEGSEWRIQWEDGLLMPELRGGNRLVMDYKVPGRANIYDRNQKAIAAQAEAVALGIVPGQIDPNQEGTLLVELSNLTDLSTETIRRLYQFAQPDWYIPVGEASAEQVNKRYNILSGLSGLQMNTFRARYYYDGGIAPQATGYVISIPAEELEIYKRQGYRGDEKIGYSGLEKWGEPYLSGRHGASLYVVDSQGMKVTRLAEVEAAPAESLYTTLDSDLQLAAQKSLEGFLGAIVVMERDSGRILAMASAPGYDPNLFEPANRNSILLGNLLSNPDQPLLNRATQGLYPLGSVFKIITTAAALESGLYTKDTTYECGYTFTELPGLTLYDWTFTKEVPPSGKLNLMEGLMRSCNPYYYHIGLDLFRNFKPSGVGEIARGFGLGSATGIGQVAEAVGNMPDAVDDGDAVQQAIGQGTMLVTPLQVADFVAAVGNGGTLYRPQLIEKISTSDGEPSYTFQKEIRGTLPISPENLKILQDSMRMVIADRRGTAFYTFVSFQVPVYGKTGTAQNPGKDAHAWFAGYTNANNPARPDIAVVVMLENQGEGSEWAAPIFRRMVEMYFFGRAERKFPWEVAPWVTKTPTPLVTDTPVPQDTPSP